MKALRNAKRRWRIERLRRRIASGLEPAGVFVPHRHAADLVPTTAPELLPLLDRALPAMREVLDAVDRHEGDVAAFGGPPPAPRFSQDWFPGLDALAAYALVRTAAPRRIVEIGSGHSTRVMARAVADAGLGTRLVAIDPTPRTTLRGLDVDWRPTLLQTTDPTVFDGLGAGDVLFVDSSHLLLAGSDVEWLLLRVLPRLGPGVLLHVHDVVLPDAYPRAWTWRGYNEQAAIAPLLLAGWQPIFASHYLRHHRPEELEGRLAERIERPPGAMETSLWLRRGEAGGT